MGGKTWVLGSVLAMALASSRPAAACGACFSPPTETTVVVGHRMAMSISKSQTVLWDQIRYSGDPAEFAWVLPVRQGARVEIAHDEFFAALEASTQTVVIGPTPQPRSGGACGGSAASSYSSSSGGTPGVEVVRQEVVGPYEVVTLAATDPNALTGWLDGHHYAVPADVKPVIAAYVAEGLDFVAMRLLPNRGVQAMRPVRVVTPGASPLLPLRMVAGGTGATVGLVLYVIGEGRWEVANFPNATIDPSDVTWDSVASRSNYAELAADAMAEGDGRTWLTEYAQGLDSARAPTLGVAYGSAIAQSCGGASDGGPVLAYPDDAAVADAGTDAELDASTDASTDGGRASPCTGFDDIDVAIRGMQRSDVWVTRLRADLPRAALASDLQLRAAGQVPITGVYQAEEGGGCMSSPSRTNGVPVVGLAALAGLWLARRRRRTRGTRDGS